MRRFLISLAMVLVLAGIMAVPAMAEGGDVPAEVTVLSVIDVSISDAEDDGIQFGPLSQGDLTMPDVAQSTLDNSVPAVIITINPLTNVNTNTSIRGTNFHPSIPITGAQWSLQEVPLPFPDGDYMSTIDQFVIGPVAPATAIELWHFLDIPGDAAGGTHASTFTYTIEASP